MTLITSQVWLLTLMSLAVVVVVMARLATIEVNLFSSSLHWDFSKATFWGLQVFTQEGESAAKRGDVFQGKIGNVKNVNDYFRLIHLCRPSTSFRGRASL